MQTTFKKGDTIIIALVLCIALLLFLLPWLQRTSGAVLSISYADGRVQTVMLDRDTTLTLENNGHTLTVVIEGGTVRVTNSTCPDGICRSHAISHTGQTLLCAPAGIALAIQDTGGEFDAVLG